jgi:hypothetical protein
MREPLNQFAARIVRSGELNEFLEGLCAEHGVNPDTIIRIGSLIRSARQNDQRQEDWKANRSMLTQAQGRRQD